MGAAEIYGTQDKPVERTLAGTRGPGSDLADAFKTFEADIRGSSESTVQLQGLPRLASRYPGIAAGGRGRGRMRFDQKAFEPS